MAKLKKVLLLGANGQLGTALQKLYPNPEIYGFEWLPSTRKDCDLIDNNKLAKYLEKVSPDIIVNAAAYTNVDGAENDQEICNLVNFSVPSTIQLYCDIMERHLIHISTDFVFGGTPKASFVETDEHAPLNVYGFTKSKADKTLMENGKEYVYILRTSWLYGPRAWGKSFYKSIMDRAEAGGALKVVTDEVGSPTSTISLSRVIFRIITDLISGNPLPCGTYHCADEGSVSRFDFAKAIIELDSQTKEVPISEITSDELPPRAAVRPKNSTLNCDKLKYHYPDLVRPWEEGLKTVYSIDKREQDEKI